MVSTVMTSFPTGTRNGCGVNGSVGSTFATGLPRFLLKTKSGAVTADCLKHTAESKLLVRACNGFHHRLVIILNGDKIFASSMITSTLYQLNRGLKVKVKLSLSKASCSPPTGDL